MSDFLDRLTDALDIQIPIDLAVPLEYRRDASKAVATLKTAALLVRDSRQPDYQAAFDVRIDPATLIDASRAELALSQETVRAIVDAATGGGRIIEMSDE